MNDFKPWPKLPSFAFAMLLMSTALVHADGAPRLSLDEARGYMLELINRDRAAAGLNPVEMDDAATKAAQKHAEEMAVNRYLSHVNLAGEKPDQRYTEAGGVDNVGENTYFWYWGRGGDPVSLPLQQPPTFARSDIEAIESTYISEVPPNDGHRRQILGRYHTHVGIGLGRAADADNVSLANTQEFVIRALELAPIPQTPKPGESIKVSGRPLGATPFYAVAVGREPLPSPKTREEVKNIYGYSQPQATTWLWPGQGSKALPDGSFEAEVKLPDEPGLYYIFVWLRDDPNKKNLDGLFTASARTIVVR